MVFSSPEFIFFFLPAVLALSLVGGVRVQNLSLMLASLLFYYYGGGVLILLLLASCVGNWAFARLVERRRERRWLVLGLLFNLGNLFYFKYANFVVDQWNGWIGQSPFAIVGWETIALPIGISFFTFQGMSYLMDVWRGEMPAYRRLSDVVLCTALFPHLIAGPIVRLSHLTPQLEQRHRRWEDFTVGAARFTWGLAKKVLIADVCGQLADGGFSTPLHRLPTEAAWLMLAAYTVQIYFDFSGYSDMAVGLARMLGFRFPENFHHPYAAVSMTDFWRRWHLSLSQWFRDYLFIPLGGSRAGKWLTYRNLIVVFLITGAWHGAAWSFVIWGAVHGVLLILERATGLSQMEGYTWPRRLIVIPVIMLTWIPFRAEDLGYAWRMLGVMAGNATGVAIPLNMSLLMDAQMYVALFVGLCAFVAPRHTTGGVWLQGQNSRAAQARTVVLVLLLPLALIQVLSTGYSPFLYFQF